MILNETSCGPATMVVVTVRVENRCRYLLYVVSIRTADQRKYSTTHCPKTDVWFCVLHLHNLSLVTKYKSMQEQHAQPVFNLHKSHGNII